MSSLLKTFTPTPRQVNSTEPRSLFAAIRDLVDFVKSLPRFEVRRVAELLNLPEGTIPAEILVLGYPEKERKPTGKKSLDEVVFYDVFE